jgi:hypothetical protein
MYALQERGAGIPLYGDTFGCIRISDNNNNSGTRESLTGPPKPRSLRVSLDSLVLADSPRFQEFWEFHDLQKRVAGILQRQLQCLASIGVRACCVSEHAGTESLPCRRLHACILQLARAARVRAAAWTLAARDSICATDASPSPRVQGGVVCTRSPCTHPPQCAASTWAR